MNAHCTNAKDCANLDDDYGLHVGFGRLFAAWLEHQSQRPIFMNRNTTQDFQNACHAIWDATSKALATRAPDILNGLAPSPQMELDKREIKSGDPALKFCIWGKEWKPNWHHEYANYNILFDQNDQTGECGHDTTLMLRFFFFTNRKATGKGKYNAGVEKILRPLDGKHGFRLGSDNKKYKLQLKYPRDTMTPAWEKKCAADLVWVLEKSFRQLTQLAKQ